MPEAVEGSRAKAMCDLRIPAALKEVRLIIKRLQKSNREVLQRDSIAVIRHLFELDTTVGRQKDLNRLLIGKLT